MSADAPRPRGPDERAWFDAAYAEHQDQLLRIVGRILPLHEAEDVVHETLLHYWQNPGGHDPTRGTIRTYLRVVARSRALDRLRGSEASKRRDTGWATGTPLVHDDAHFDDREVVFDALRTLTPPQREAIVIAFFGDLSYVEVAERLGVPEGTVKTRIRAGLANLRSALSAPDHASGQQAARHRPVAFGGAPTEAS